MFAKIRRPSSTAETTVDRSSSRSTRSAACRATSVPPRPAATPMSAQRSAGASLTPSPIIATTSPRPCRDWTISTFCSARTRENTTSSRPASVSETMPTRLAIACAVPG
jgi:hypothetical protein